MDFTVGIIAFGFRRRFGSRRDLGIEIILKDSPLYLVEDALSGSFGRREGSKFWLKFCLSPFVQPTGNLYAIFAEKSG